MTIIKSVKVRLIYMGAIRESKKVVSKMEVSNYEKLYSRLDRKEGRTRSINWRM